MGWGPARLREKFGSLWVGISRTVSRLNKEVGGRWTDLCNNRFVVFDKVRCCAFTKMSDGGAKVDEIARLYLYDT
jgi:hypothetical protein